MTMTLAQLSQLANDEALIQRVQAAVINAAVAVATESATTTNHTNRALLSYNVLNADDDTYARRFAWALTTNATVTNEYNFDQTNIPDADIQFVVNGLWDAIAKTGS